MAVASSLLMKLAVAGVDKSYLLRHRGAEMSELVKKDTHCADCTKPSSWIHIHKIESYHLGLPLQASVCVLLKGSSCLHLLSSIILIYE